MKILVVSDSHGLPHYILEAIRLENPDRLLHLGDGLPDLMAVRLCCPALPVDYVRGNCDSPEDGPQEQTLILEGHRIWMLHGHTKGVKRDLDALRTATKEEKAELVLFGHTHTSLYMQQDKLHMLNPGSIGPYSKREYGVLELTKETIDCRIETVIDFSQFQ